MRYCTLTLVFALLAVAVGCSSTPYAGPRGFGQGECSYGGAAVGAGAVPGYYSEGYGAGGSYMDDGGSQSQTTQVQFIGPDEMAINYDVSAHGMFDSEPIICSADGVAAVHNFRQGDIYRLKLSNIAALPGRNLYPTIEIAPGFVKTQAFLAHNMVPVQFTDADLDQVAAGNFITKVVYLPHPEFQGLATAGVGTLVNTQLEPGVDPILEAANRGAILAVIRIGNKDLSMEQDMSTSGTIISEESYVVTPSNMIPNPPQISGAYTAPKAPHRTVMTVPPQPTVLQ